MATVASVKPFDSGTIKENGVSCLLRRTISRSKVQRYPTRCGPFFTAPFTKGVEPYKSIDYQLVRDSCKPLFTRFVLFLGNLGSIPMAKRTSVQAFSIFQIVLFSGRCSAIVAAPYFPQGRPSGLPFFVAAVRFRSTPLHFPSDRNRYACFPPGRCPDFS